jgi:hypothetical protein
VTAPVSAPAPDDTAGVQDRAKNLERIARELEGTVFGITHEGSARIIAEHERQIAEIEALRAKDGSNAEAVDQLIAQSAAVRDAQLSQLRAKEVEAAEKVRAANEKVVASLEVERQALAQTERERFVAQALSRLSAEATAQQISTLSVAMVCGPTRRAETIARAAPAVTMDGADPYFSRVLQRPTPSPQPRWTARRAGLLLSVHLVDSEGRIPRRRLMLPRSTTSDGNPHCRLRTLVSAP